MNTELVLERLNGLPEVLQFQVYDYIEFLYSRYGKKEELVEETKTEELEPELEALLLDRLEDYHQNPEDVMTWDEVEQEFV